MKSRVAAQHSPTKVEAGKTRTKLTIAVTANGVVPTGTIKVSVPGQGTTELTLKKGKATLRLHTFNKPGRKVVTIAYAGDDRVLPSRTTEKIRIVKHKK